jgi:hypothetical protein
MPPLAVRLLACALACSVVACSSGEIARRTELRDHDAAAVAVVRLSSTNGDVTVERRGDAPRLELEVALEVGGTSEEQAAARLLSTAVRTSLEDGELSAWVEFPEPRHALDVAHLRVRAPRPVAAVLKTANGSLRCTDLERAVDAHTRNGSIEVLGRHGDVLARSVNGSIEIRGASGRVAGETKDGRVVLALPDEARAGFELQCENGSIELTAPKALRGQVLLQTRNGDLEVLGIAAPAEVEEGSARVIRLPLGAGGAESFARTQNGSIRCELR